MANQRSGWGDNGHPEIAAALDQIVTSQAFLSSERQQRLLRYLVKETLAGRAERLSQYAIAIDVLGRDERFDPSIDSAVRVEAGRLRSKLHEYYNTLGAEDNVQVSLPRGSYAPDITIDGKAYDDPAQVQANEAVMSVPDEPSIAVLPFVNMSGDPEQEYFSDGVSEEILNALNAVEGLHVAARTSAFSFKNKNVDIKEIGKTLQVKHVIEGSVRRAIDRLRITAQLISVKDGFKVWSDSYDRQLTDVFAVQEDIAAAVVNALRIELSVDSNTPLIVRPTASIDAYDSFLRGRYSMRQWGSEAFKSAIDDFQNAVNLAPDYADAYGNLAYALALSSLYKRYYDVASRTEENINHALELNSKQPEALAAKAFLSFTDWREVGQLIETALQAAGDDSLMVTHYVRAHLSVVCRFSEAHPILDAATTKDPLSYILLHARARVLFHSGDLEAAAKVCERSLELEPNS
jgi:TolB-like protein